MIRPNPFVTIKVILHCIHVLYEIKLNCKVKNLFRNPNIFPRASNSVEVLPTVPLEVPNSTQYGVIYNPTYDNVTFYDGSGGNDVSGSGSGDFDEYYEPLYCSALNGIKSEAIVRKFAHLMQNIYKA